jgi:hypothetical protein
MSAFAGKADIKTGLIPDFLIPCETVPRRLPLARLSWGLIFGWSSLRETLVHPHRLTEFCAPLTFAIFLAHAASAQVTDRMKATAPEKMMPVDKALKMRECEKRMEQQKIKMEDRSRFLDECVWAKAK